LPDHFPRCKDSLDCAMFIGLTHDQPLVMVCKACSAELMDPQVPACFRPVTLEELALTTVGPSKSVERLTACANWTREP
jgi:hypothetical protein